MLEQGSPARFYRPTSVPVDHVFVLTVINECFHEHFGESEESILRMCSKLRVLILKKSTVQKASSPYFPIPTPSLTSWWGAGHGACIVSQC